MSSDQTAPQDGPDPTRIPAGDEAGNRTDDRPETVPGPEVIDPERFTDRGEAAESAAFRGDGAYSGGDFAGGDVAT